MRRLVDCVAGRVEGNLTAVADTMLVELPTDRSYTYEEFNDSQKRFQKKQAEQLVIRNQEVMPHKRSSWCSFDGPMRLGLSLAMSAVHLTPAPLVRLDHMLRCCGASLCVASCAGGTGN